MVRQAVILAGGKGTRLRSRLGDLPKPLVDVDGVPLLQRQLACLQENGVTDVLLLVNHRAEAIRHFVQAHGSFGLDVKVIDDGEPRGTSGAVLAAFDSLQECFVVLYGDLLLDVDIPSIYAAHASKRAEVTLFLHPNTHPADSDIVQTTADGRVIALHKYPHPPGFMHRNLVNAAFYVVNKAALAPFRTDATPLDFCEHTFPAMLAGGVKFHGYSSFEYIKDIGTPARLDAAVADLRCGKIARARRSIPQKAVFLDRDGTLIHEVGHLRHHEQLALLPGVATAITRLREAEYRCIVVTNQPVIARGECSRAELERIHGKLDMLLGTAGAALDAIYYCPHHPESGHAGEIPALKRVCSCRKPAIGLISQAAADLNVDLTRSWMVGDATADIETARRAGLRSVLVQTGHGGRDAKFPLFPTATAAHLADAAEVILAAGATGTVFPTDLLPVEHRGHR